jgi:RNA polymerase sigma-70 factor (ECF subfamily)
MHADETNAVFATTHWSVVLAADGTDTPAANAALETLLRAYWKPLYFYLRQRGQTHHDAEDLVQAFFRRFLEKDAVREASQQRGRFRSFLLASLKNFLLNERDRAMTLKRGGSLPHLPLDDTAAVEASASALAASDSSPEQVFDREWAQTVFDLALRRLEREFIDDGKEAQFSALAPFLHQPPGPGDYERVAAQIGLRAALMPTVVLRLRQRFRDLVRTEIAATVATPAEVDAEMRYLVELLVK